MSSKDVAWALKNLGYEEMQTLAGAVTQQLSELQQVVLEGFADGDEKSWDIVAHELAAALSCWADEVYNLKIKRG